MSHVPDGGPAVVLSVQSMGVLAGDGVVLSFVGYLPGGDERWTLNGEDVTTGGGLFGLVSW